MEIDWDPSHGSAWNWGIALNEIVLLTTAYGISPDTGARFSDYFADYNKQNALKDPFSLVGIQGVDMDIAHSSTLSDAIWPTAKLVGAAAVAWFAPYLLPAAVPAGDWVGRQMGIEESESDYGKWAGFIGAAIGLGGKAYSDSQTDTPTTPTTTTPKNQITPSASADPGYNPGTGANQNPTQYSKSVDFQKYMTWLNTAKDIYGQAAPYMPKTAPAVKPPLTTTPKAGAAGSDGVSPVLTYGLLAAGALLVIQKFK